MSSPSYRPSFVGDPSYQPTIPFGCPGGTEIRLNKPIRPDPPPRLRLQQLSPPVFKSYTRPVQDQGRAIIGVEKKGVSKKPKETPALPISDNACSTCRHTHFILAPPEIREVVVTDVKTSTDTDSEDTKVASEPNTPSESCSKCRAKMTK